MRGVEAPNIKIVPTVSPMLLIGGKKLCEWPDRPCATCRRIFSPTSSHQAYCRDCQRDYYRERRASGRCKCNRPNCGIGIKGFGGGRPRRIT